MSQDPKKEEKKDQSELNDEPLKIDKVVAPGNIKGGKAPPPNRGPRLA